MEKFSEENLEKIEVQNIFENIDTYRNSHIEPEEFIRAAIDKKIFLKKKMIKLVFNFFDISNDGFITSEDIIEFYRDSNEMERDKEAKEEFEKYKFEDFSVLMKKLLEN